MKNAFNAEGSSSNPLNELLAKIPLKDLAKKLGTDEATASEALGAALPALLAKLQDNASSQGGAASLASALQGHSNNLASGSQVNLDQVDTQDGNSILSHVFGNQRQEVAQQLAGTTSKASSGILESLLPLIAPIAMSFLSNNLLGGNQQKQQSVSPDLSSLLGGLLGGRQADQSSSAGGLDVGALLGGLFGKRS